MPKATRIEPTEQLLKTLCKAQAEHTAAILSNPYNRMGDDWGDTTCSALDVMGALFRMYWDQVDLEGLDKYLNTPQEEADEDGMIDLPQSGGETPHLSYCAGEGICDALGELNPISMERD